MFSKQEAAQILELVCRANISAVEAEIVSQLKAKLRSVAEGLKEGGEDNKPKLKKVK